jgi:Bacterial protein of unknown function (DUF922)
MTHLFILLFSFFSHQNFLLPDNEIRWQQERKLTFGDFKGDVPLATPWAATTSSMIHFSYESDGSKISRVVVSASFIPEKSWMKKRLPEVLAHEQLHFDITEIFARKFYQEVIKVKSANKNELSALFKKVNSECDKFQEQYDGETDHGTKEEIQAKWKEKVTALLLSTPPYPVQL